MIGLCPPHILFWNIGEKKQYKSAPEKWAEKIRQVINNSAAHCPILLKFRKLMH